MAQGVALSACLECGSHWDYVMHNENTLPLELRSATELLRLLRERRVGSLELLDLQLSRIERVNPMGLQVVGPYLQDRTSLRFAQLTEQALGGYVPPPVG